MVAKKLVNELRRTVTASASVMTTPVRKSYKIVLARTPSLLITSNVEEAVLSV